MFTKYLAASLIMVVNSTASLADAPVAFATRLTHTPVQTGLTTTRLESRDINLEHACPVSSSACMSWEEIAKLQPCLLSASKCDAHARNRIANARADWNL